MDFARKQLEKYGWSDGKGLGRYENGIPEALKPKLKRSVTGIGHDAAAEFTEHWWSALYDKAAKNVEVEEKNGKTKKIKTKDDTHFEITNSTWRLNRKNNNSDEEQYKDYFVRKAVLTNGGSQTEKVEDTDSESDDDVKKDVFKMTDEELFAACEGRTAHKGARHGLKALGKLARVEEQEQLLLKQSKYYGYSKKLKSDSTEELQVVEDLSLNDNKEPNKKKKKRKRRCYSNDNNSSIIEEKDVNVNEPCTKVSNRCNSGSEEKEKRIKLKKSKEKDYKEDTGIVVSEETESELHQKKKKKCKNKSVEDSPMDSVTDEKYLNKEEPCTEYSKKSDSGTERKEELVKSKKSKKKEYKEDTGIVELEEIESEVHHKSKKKKRKNKEEDLHIDELLNHQDQESDTVIVKKKKKRLKDSE